MTESAGWATLDVIPSMKGFRRALDRGTAGDFAAVGRAGGARLGDEAGKAASGRLKSRLGGTIREMFAPAAGILAGAGIVAGFKSVVNAASEAQQSVGGVQAVFGKYADEVIGKSKEAAQALGLSSTAYQELATVSAALLKNKGISDYTEQAQKLLQVGADLAAQYGGTTKDAVDALNAAMRGESDPIERYGVSLNQTAVNAELAKQGLANLKGAAQQQAQTQARLAIITQQTADAQGAFARESDTLAGAQQRAQAQWENMRAELGQKFLPVLTDVVGFMNTKALPALEDAGGVAADAAKAFGSLPGPVKTAAVALAAFRGAQALGLTGAAGSGFSAMRKGLDDVRLRAMLAKDEYRGLRTAQLTYINGAPKFTAASGRMTASLGAMQTAAAGAGARLRGGFRGVVNMLGGPWGIAIAGGTALLAKFWSEQQEAKAHVEALTDSLSKQTGAITDNTRQQVINKLEKEGLLKQADRLGFSLDTVTNAALGNTDAMRQLQAASRAATQEVMASRRPGNPQVDRDLLDRQQAIRDLVDALGGESDALADSRAEWDRRNRAAGETNSTQEKVTRKIRDYRGEIDKARDALQKLLDKENERRNKNLSAFDALTRLQAAFRDAMKEADEGARTLDRNTEAGEKNRDALSSLAREWNDAPKSVQNAKGAYEDIRKKFIDVAEQMGASKTQARNLAQRLLEIPDNVAPKFSTPGLEKARANIKKLQDDLKRAQELATVRLRVIGPADVYRPEFGHGVGQQPYASPQTPKREPSMFDFRGSTIQAHDYQDFTNQMKRRQRSAALDGWGG